MFLIFALLDSRCLSETVFLPSQGRGKVTYTPLNPDSTCGITLGLLLLLCSNIKDNVVYNTTSKTCRWIDS